MAVNQKNSKAGQTADYLQLQDFFSMCLAQWKWFLLSLVITCGIATIYLLCTPNIYTRTTSVLIKEDSQGGASSGMESFADLGLFQSTTNINNEMQVFQSPALIAEVVKRLDLTTSYYMPGKFHQQVAYGTTLPVIATFCNLDDQSLASFLLQITADGTLALSDFTWKGEDMESSAIKGRFSDTIPSPVGPIVLKPTAAYTAGQAYTLHINRMPLHAMVNAVINNLTVALSNEKSSIIDLSYKDQSTQRAENILNMLVAVYNENWVKDKNQIAISTSLFINDRLNIIEQELGNVDENISSYKAKNLLPDIQTASSMYFTQSNEINSQILALNNQRYMAHYIRNYLADDTNDFHLLPANSGIGGSNIESQIDEYNRQLLQRNNLVANSSESNPLVISMDQSLSAIRVAIIRSIDNLLVTLDNELKTLQQSEQQANSHIAASPSQAKYLLSVERQQKVKEALYLFLLQKREENELSQAFTAYNTRIITPPYGSMKPTAPLKKNILLVAFAIGLLIPAIIIFLRETMNTRIRGRKDLEGLSIPFIGEIPLHAYQKKKWYKKGRSETQSMVVVREGRRDVINEAFRVLRTNLEFMADNNRHSNVIIVTSFNPGSGKSFLTLNMAVSLAIKGKKTLLIDGDLRHASTSSFIHSPATGLSNYLSGRVDQLSDIIIKDAQYKNLDVMPVGTIPPNPTELLFNDRFRQLIDTVKQSYDYVFIDCPPIGLVADTQIIEKWADRTIFVVRAGLLERNMLEELETIYNEQKFKNMALILNGTEENKGRYGYRYGYGYYASSYHYDYASDTDK